MSHRPVTSSRWTPRAGLRSDRIRSSTSALWRPAELRLSRLLRAYMRRSASRSASVGGPASAGSSTEPYEAVTLKPSPLLGQRLRGEQRAIVSRSAQPGRLSTQNSSPPMR